MYVALPTLFARGAALALLLVGCTSAGRDGPATPSLASAAPPIAAPPPSSRPETPPDSGPAIAAPPPSSIPPPPDSASTPPADERLVLAEIWPPCCPDDPCCGVLAPTPLRRESVAVAGTLAHARVDQALVAESKALAACFRPLVPSSDADPTASLRMSLKLQVARDGSTRLAAVTGLDHAGARECLTALVAKLRLPAADSAATVSYSLTLGP